MVESDADVAMFGVQAIDTIVGVADLGGVPLDETSILWYGITPSKRTARQTRRTITALWA